MTTTFNYLQNEYGPLMTLENLAKILDRSPQGLRVSLSSISELSVAINAVKIKRGRRIYFYSEGIAKIIDGEATE